MKQTETITKEFVNLCIIRVEAETTGMCGGDAGHGGFTRIRIKDLASTYMSAEVVNDSAIGDDADEIVLTFRGDAEQQVLAEALTWLGKRLTDIYADPNHGN